MHARLGELASSALFVGPATRDTFLRAVSDAPRPPPATLAVGLTWDIESDLGFAALAARLDELGFRWSRDEQRPERWSMDGLEVHVSPPAPTLRGFTNVWHKSALGSPRTLETARGALRVVDAAHFLASGFETLTSSRTADDRAATLGDLLLVVSDYPAVVRELERAPSELLQFVAGECAELVDEAALKPALDEQQRRRLSVIAKFARAKSRTPLVERSPEVAELPPLAWQPERSGAIRSVLYDRVTQTLTVEFIRGPSYEYSGVPPLVHAAWKNAVSVGHYHNRWIRDCYPCRKLD